MKLDSGTKIMGVRWWVWASTVSQASVEESSLCYQQGKANLRGSSSMELGVSESRRLGKDFTAARACDVHYVFEEDVVLCLKSLLCPLLVMSVTKRNSGTTMPRRLEAPGMTDGPLIIYTSLAKATTLFMSRAAATGTILSN